MKTMGLLVAITISTVPTESRAQAVRVTVATPTVRFETAPQLVEVSPGVQVVPEYGEEVFFVDGWYWCRAGGAWFRRATIAAAGSSQAGRRHPAK